MRILLLFLTFVIVANVEAFECDKMEFEDNELGLALIHLASLDGRHKVGSCLVEIKFCSNSSSENSENPFFVGDVFVVNGEGQERYIPIYAQKAKLKKSHGLLKRTESSFIYRFKDKNKDDLSGDYEWFDLEIVRTPNSNSIDYIEVGHSSQTERRRKEEKKWIICGDEREEYVKKHPIKFRYRSWWWWLTHF